MEKTLGIALAVVREKKHLHVCGENLRGMPSGKSLLETPPRVWRKRAQCHRHAPYTGNTSTCVEKTWNIGITPCLYQKHLHVCGENVLSLEACEYAVETPPRVWRKLERLRFDELDGGNTSTCVEKTPYPIFLRLFQRKHLHVCGENIHL